jgi:hypothetical protein
MEFNYEENYDFKNDIWKIYLMIARFSDNSG